jgi:hypothetical protein
MSDNIQSIRFVPQITNLNPNARTGDKKNNKENKKDFSKQMSGDEIDSDGKRHNQVKANNENTEHKKQNIENSVHEKNDDDFDNGCGSLLDTEL